MEHKKIERINELSRLSRERELTEEEQSERAALRKEYLEGWRENMKDMLEHMTIQRPDGTMEPLRKKDSTIAH